MIGFETHAELPELARVFRLERNDLSSDKKSKTDNKVESPVKGHEIGFDYRAATDFLRENPEQVQYVIYKGGEKESSSPCVFNETSMGNNNENYASPAALDAVAATDSTATASYATSSNSISSLHSPLGWACIETAQEEEAMEFLRTIRDIDPTLFLLQDNLGALPIEGDCILNAPIPMIRFLLEIYLDHDFLCPNGPKMTEDNFNSLTCLCGSYWWEDIRKAHQEIVSGERIVKGTNVLEDNLGIDDDFWERIILLVKAFYHKTTDEVQEEEEPNANNSTSSTTQLLHISNEYGDRTIQFRMLHACAGIDWFPPNLLRLLVAAFPEALLDRDEDGNLPIHVAASGVFNSYKIGGTWDGHFEANSGYQKTTIDVFLEANPGLASIPDGDGKLPLELALQSEHPNVYVYGRPMCRPWEDGGIRSLLEAYPESARIRSLATGKLPLEIVLGNHRDWEDGILVILEAYPEAAGFCNPSNGKFPLQLAIEKEIHFDDGVYSLLEASPMMVTNERCLGDETNDERITSRTTKDLPLFAQAASADCSVSVIYKLLRLWPQPCKVAKRKTGSSNNEKQLETTSKSYEMPSGKRQKLL